MIARLFISPSLESRKETIQKELANNSINPNHPDLIYFKEDEKLGIEQARKIKDHFSFKGYQAQGKILVIENAGNLTIEAQNALLKILEEPPEQALIILGAKSTQDLLPTFLSRCQIIELNHSIKDKLDDNNEITVLVSATLEERFHYIEKLKDKNELLDSLVQFWRKKLVQNPNKESAQFTAELLQAEKWANQNVNIRAILEYLMLVMPKV